ncbi:MAG: protein kinase domain-containing protein [Myxococcota bacterium]
MFYARSPGYNSTVPQSDELDQNPSASPPAGAPGHRSPSGELREGALFAGRYRIESLLGRGGMGAVYRVVDEMVGETVALKTLAMQDEGLAPERFRREVRLARRITSPHVARTHDLGSHEGVHFLTMELVLGSSLSDVLRASGTFAPAQAAWFGAQIAEGLQAAHEAGVVHRDLKPDNVLVEAGTGRVVVTDFGIARALNEQSAQRTVGIIGTPTYMAPEQVEGALVEAGADVYALGLVLYELLTGEAAFSGDSPVQIAVQRLLRRPPDPRTRRAVPDAIADIVLRCLARAPSERPGAEEVARALREAAGALGEPAGALGEAAGAPETRSKASDDVAVSSDDSTVVLSRLAHALAVVPFGHRGPPDQAWIAEGIVDELIDTLSRTRGVRVLARGAIDALGTTRDPRELGRALSVDRVIDGTVQTSGSLLRVTVRLLEAKGGTQQWSERFEIEALDVALAQERVARRIAEAIRVLVQQMHGAAGAMSPDLLELYGHARHRLRGGNVTGAADTVLMLERVLERAPGFAPAHAAHAFACLRAWYFPAAGNDRDFRDAAQRSLERALALAPELPEAHLVQAEFASQEGRYRDAIAAARVALALAPTLAGVHQLLGKLQIEAGRAKDGLARTEHALELEPDLVFALMEKARWHALYGELGVFRTVTDMWSEDPTRARFVAMLLLRSGAYRADEGLVREGVELLERHTHLPPLAAYGRVMLGDRASAELFEDVDKALAGPVSDRFRTMHRQMAAEVWGRVGDEARTLDAVVAGANSGLVDLDWIDRCPLLDLIRARAELSAARQQVAMRCEAIWAS